ncbi:COPII subunit [Entomophthora muscae]|nr:COPII subunit [Entomophthora muscae]
MLSTVIFSIKELLGKLPEDNRIGFVTVDSSAQYYNFTNETDYPSMLVVSEFEESYIPLPINALVVQLGSHMPAINAFLDCLEMLFETSRKTESCLGSVLEALASAQYSGPGSFLVFQTTLPNIGEGILVKTGGVSLLGTNKEYKLLVEKTRFYRNFTLSLNEKERSVDFFVFNSDFDLPSVAPLSRNTGGMVHYYPTFRNGEPSQEIFFRDLENLFERNIHSTLIRNVVPRGLYVSSVLGGLTQVASSASFGATTNYGDSLYFVCDFDEGMIYFDTSLGKLISFQATVEYLNAQGQSIIRVINYSLPATSSIDILHGSLNAAVYACYILRQQAMLALYTPLDQLRANLKDCVTSYLSQPLQKHNYSPAGSLHVPHNARALPYFIHAALKHPSFQSGSQVSPNERTIAHQALIRWAPELIINLICPPLLHLQPSTLLPDRLNLSSEQVSKPGIYALDVDHQVWCWVSNGVDAYTLQSYFNVDSYHALPSGQTSLASLPPFLFQTLKSHFSQRPHSVSSCPHSVFIIKESDPTQAHWRQAFLAHFIEDQNQLGPSYQQYLKELILKLTPSQ